MAITRNDIASDATAVLQFDDGTRIPCDRFIMRAFSGVISRLLADAVPTATDEHRRTVIPVPGQESHPFWTAVDLVHGVGVVSDMDLAGVTAAMGCMAYLNVTVHDVALDLRLWQLLRAEPLPQLLPYAPRLLRSAVVAASVARRLVQLCPAWEDFRRTVLAALEPYADGVLVDAVVAHAPNFFPAHLVVDWALSACPHLTQPHALRIATQHCSMYHPCDAPLVLRRLVALFDANGWCPDTARFMRGMAVSMEKYDSAPTAAFMVHGSVLRFHDSPTASVCLSIEPGSPPRAVRVTRWLRVDIFRDGRFDISFVPRKIDTLSAACTRLQLRVMCYGPTAGGAAPEAWYLFDGIGDGEQELDGDRYTLGHARSVIGAPAAVARALQRCGAKRMRCDFFFGAASVLDAPFDVPLDAPLDALFGTSKAAAA